MDLANPAEGANLGIFSELAMPTEAEADNQNAKNTDNSEERAKTTEIRPETTKVDTEVKSRRVKAKLGDREIEFDVVTDDVDLESVPKGLMMESDYRQKTQALSNERRDFESSKSKLDQALIELHSQLEFDIKGLQSEEMLELKEIDPDQYYQKVGQVENRVQSYKKHKEDRQLELSQQQNQFAEQQRQSIAESLQKLPEFIPEWLDTEVQQKDIGKINEFLTSNGFTEQEKSGLTDPRVISAFRKAALYDEIESTSLDGKRKNKAPKSSSPGSTNTDKDAPELTLAETFYGIE